MIARDMLDRPMFRASGAALAVATALVIWTLIRAVRIDGLPEMAAPRQIATGPLVGIRPHAPLNIDDVVDNDIFAPDRSAPGEPYRMPDDVVAEDVVPVEQPKPVVLGTAVGATGRSFAICQLGGGHSVIVRVGEKIGDYTIKSIERGRVVFTTPAGIRLDIPAQRPGT